MCVYNCAFISQLDPQSKLHIMALKRPPLDPHVGLVQSVTCGSGQAKVGIVITEAVSAFRRGTWHANTPKA